LRRAVHAVIEASQFLSYSRLVVTKQKRICCIGKTSVATPSTPTEIISGAVEIMLEIRPYLDMLAEIMPNWPRQSSNPAESAAG